MGTLFEEGTFVTRRSGLPTRYSSHHNENASGIWASEFKCAMLQLYSPASSNLMTAPQFLVACGDKEHRDLLMSSFEETELRPVVADSVSEAHAILSKQPISLTFCEDRLRGGGYRELLCRTSPSGSRVPVVVLSTCGDSEQYVEAMNQGAVDYITPPYRRGDIELIVNRRGEKRVEVRLPVEVYGTSARGLPFFQVARTRNISDRGALLEGITCELQPDALIGVRCCDKEATFRVVWVVRATDCASWEAGIHSLVPADPIWGFSALKNDKGGELPAEREWGLLLDLHTRYGTST